MSASAASGSPSPSTPLVPKVPCPASRASLLRATAVAWRNARRFERDLPWLRFSSCASVASMRVPRVPTQLCVNRAILPSKASVAALTNCSSRVARVVNSRCAFARVSRMASAAARHLDAAASARDARLSWPASTRAMSPPCLCRRQLRQRSSRAFCSTLHRTGKRVGYNCAPQCGPGVAATAGFEDALG